MYHILAVWCLEQSISIQQGENTPILYDTFQGYITQLSSKVNGIGYMGLFLILKN